MVTVPSNIEQHVNVVKLLSKSFNLIPLGYINNPGLDACRTTNKISEIVRTFKLEHMMQFGC